MQAGPRDRNVRPMLRLAAFALFLALVVFVPAGTLRFWQGWVFGFIFVAACCLLGVYFLKHDPALLALGSTWTLLLLIPMIPLLAWRLLDEERFLTRNLPGYAAYCRQVRYRLVPGVW